MIYSRYLYTVLSRPKAVCASGRYNESQTTASGPPTSLVVPHQSEVQTEPRQRVAVEPAADITRYPPPSPLPRQAVVEPFHRACCRGSEQRWSSSMEPVAEAGGGSLFTKYKLSCVSCVWCSRSALFTVTPIAERLSK